MKSISVCDLDPGSFLSWRRDERTVALLVDAREVQRPEQAEQLANVSYVLASHGGVRTALIVCGSMNPICGEILRLAAFYRIVSEEPAKVAGETVKIVESLAALEAEARKYLAEVKKWAPLRSLLGTALCLVDEEYRIWYMDTAHNGHTGGGAVEGQLCWHGYHDSRHQQKHCRNCAVAAAIAQGDSVGPRMIASPVEGQLRFFAVAATSVCPGSSGKLIAEFSCEVTDTPVVATKAPEELLKSLMETVTSRGFAKARCYSVHKDHLQMLACDGYRESDKVMAVPLEAKDDRYCLNTLHVARKPQIYAENDLGKEEFRDTLQKGNVTWWMEFPFLDETGEPFGLLAVDNENAAWDRHIRRLLEVQPVADCVKSIIAREVWLQRKENDIERMLVSLCKTGYESASVWNFWDNSSQAIRGYLCKNTRRDVRGTLTSLYRERFLYEVAALHKIPLVFDRLAVVEGSSVCKDYVAGTPQVLVFPLLSHGQRLVGFLIVSNPESGHELTREDIGRIQPLAGSLGSILAGVQPLLTASSLRALPVLLTKNGDAGDCAPGTTHDTAINLLVDRICEATDATHVVIRVLKDSSLEAVAQRGFSVSVPPVVNVRDKHAQCARAMRLGFPDVQNNLVANVDFLKFSKNAFGENSKEYQDLKSMITMPIQDAAGFIGTVELFSNRHSNHFASQTQREWIASFALRLACILRSRSGNVGEISDIRERDIIQNVAGEE